MARTDNLENFLTDVADAIREKKKKQKIKYQRLILIQRSEVYQSKVNIKINHLILL